MPLVNVSEVIIDPDFNQEFTYIRRKVVWDNGRVTTEETQNTTNGVLIVQDNKNLDVTPEGALTNGSLMVWSYEELYVTSESNTPQPGDYLSDIILYKNERYILVNTRPVDEYGYYRYTGVVESAS